MLGFLVPQSRQGPLAVKRFSENHEVDITNHTVVGTLGERRSFSGGPGVPGEMTAGAGGKGDSAGSSLCFPSKEAECVHLYASGVFGGTDLP